MRLWVRDDGPGIPEAERERVLRRFYRMDVSRQTPGNGLGLSLVAAIATRHHGMVALSDASPGLLVDILIPLWPAASDAPPDHVCCRTKGGISQRHRQIVSTSDAIEGGSLVGRWPTVLEPGAKNGAHVECKSNADDE